MSGQLILNDPFTGTHRTADSGFVKMNDIEARLSLNLPLRQNQNPVNFSIEVKAPGHTGQFNMIQKITIEDGNAKSEIYNKKGDISLDKNGNGKRSLSISGLSKKINKKKQVNLSFEAIPSQKTTSSTVGELPKPQLPAVLTPIVQRKERQVYYYQPEEKIYNSKESTGYVGLINQGATCYMNSSLQTLFTIPAIRNLIYRFPITSFTIAEQTRDVSFKLQTLFLKLHNETETQTTEELTKAFGWDNEVYIQHDAAEFIQALLEALYRKISRNPDFIARFDDLFKIVHYNMVSPVNSDSWSIRGGKLTSRMIELPITNADSVDQALMYFTAPGEIDDQIEIDGVRTNALLKIQLEKLPKILPLHLLRFNYSRLPDGSFGRVKLSKRVEFSETIMMHSDLDQDIQYSLHGVICHSGSATGGHYYSFIKPSMEESWLLFNDDTVKTATHDEVFENNFEGGAYILFYVRSDCEDEIYKYDLNPPRELVDFFDKSFDTCEIKLITQEGIKQNCIHKRPGLLNANAEFKITTAKLEKISEFIPKVRALIGIDYPFTIFRCDPNQRPVEKCGLNETVGESVGNSKYLFICPGDIQQDSIILFKKFDPATLSLDFMGCCGVSSDSTLGQAAEFITGGDPHFAFYIETKQQATKVDPESIISQSNLAGSVIVVQPDIGTKFDFPESDLNYLTFYPDYNDGQYSTFMELQRYSTTTIVGFNTIDQTLSQVQLPSNIDFSEFRHIFSTMFGVAEDTCQIFRLNSGNQYMKHLKADNNKVSTQGKFTVSELSLTEDQRPVIVEMNRERHLHGIAANTTLADLGYPAHSNSFIIENTPSMKSLNINEPIPNYAEYIYVDPVAYETPYIYSIVDSGYKDEIIVQAINYTDGISTFEKLKQFISSTFSSNLRVSIAEAGDTVVTNSTQMLQLIQAFPSAYVRISSKSSNSSTEQSIVFYN